MIIYRLLSISAVVFSANTSLGDSSIDAQVMRELAGARGDLAVPGLTHGKKVFQTFNSDHAYNLKEMGPNVLPRAMQAYRSESVLNSFHFLLWRLITEFSQFTEYQYATEAQSGNPKLKHFVDTELGSVPYLSACIDNYKLGDESELSKRKALVLGWWDQRDTFLRRTDVIEKVRGITGTKEEDYGKWGMQMYRQLEKHVLTYGIYNIPYFIQVVREDNNPIIFWTLLRLVRHDVFVKNATPGFDQPRLMQTLYPSCKSKLDLLIKDWEDNKHKYTNLPDLYAAIDAQIKAAKETVDASK